MWRFSKVRVNIHGRRHTFQYIKCDGSAVSLAMRIVARSYISIHQMWRFSFWPLSHILHPVGISIHQMWRFSRLEKITRVVRVRISIHQMWRFSRSERTTCLDGWRNFNTSNVTVQLCAHVNIASISKYFNTSNVTVQPHIRICIFLFIKFQYIKCDGSAKSSHSSAVVCHSYFNTSNVTVQLYTYTHYQTRYYISIHQMWRFS